MQVDTKILVADPKQNISIFANVSVKDMQVRRMDKKNRHRKNGTFHNNKGFMVVGRSPYNGQFVSMKETD
jgi:hypothetical protein